MNLKLRWLGSAIGAGTIAIAVLLVMIDHSAAQSSISSPLTPINLAAPGIVQSNLLINPDFENGSQPYPGHANIQVPNGWDITWSTDVDPATGYTFFQPEVKLDDNTQWPYCAGCAPNVPPRIHSGRYAVDALNHRAVKTLRSINKWGIFH